MEIVAKAIKGAEYMYTPRSAHQVRGISAKKMCKFLNDQVFDLNQDEVWHVFDVGPYDNAYAYGSIQWFEKQKSGQVVKKGARV